MPDSLRVATAVGLDYHYVMSLNQVYCFPVMQVHSGRTRIQRVERPTAAIWNFCTAGEADEGAHHLH
jgi:hypothetical protein